MSQKVLITGSSGLIGSEAVAFFSDLGWEVHGIDNNMRRDFFGEDGDTTWNLHRLQEQYPKFVHHAMDIRDRAPIAEKIQSLFPDLIIHAAAQPSHDLAASRPFDDFDINAVGTLNLLEATRLHAPEAVFIFMSTNKVYGDAPNEIPLVETQTRYDYANQEDFHGVKESCRIDACLHSLFGASKVAADVLVQEYGKYFDMPTVCLRGGCLTGPNHSSAELHGFLAYLARCAYEKRPYKIFGYKGKQVRDNIHSYDVCTMFLALYQNPPCGEVYNLGGERDNSLSVLEAISHMESLSGNRMEVEYVDQARRGDHICYFTDLRKFRRDYPKWKKTKSIHNILEEVYHGQLKVVK